MTKICIPISEKDPKKLLEKIALAQKSNADILEIWLGEVSSEIQNNPDFLQKIITAAEGKPLLANCKNAREKGSFVGNDAEKMDILLSASQSGFDFLDCDFNISEDSLTKFFAKKNPKTQLILSAHFWDGTPAIHGLLRVAEKMRTQKADICKFATTPRDFRDVITALRLSEKLNSKSIPHIVIAMGEMGKMTRFFAPLLRNEMTFAALDDASATAPGQISAEKLQKFWKENL